MPLNLWQFTMRTVGPIIKGHSACLRCATHAESNFILPLEINESQNHKYKRKLAIIISPSVYPGYVLLIEIVIQ